MNRTIPLKSIRQFRKTVYDHFQKYGRSLPWRQGYGPYHIFVSEVMLQQTQVDRVALKFDPFVTALPDFTALADAPLSKILLLWQGLGYNRRAVNLKRAAQTVIKKHDGRLPSSPEILETLPGIGKATAASIAAFAFNVPAVFLETNIRTVLIHHFFKDKIAIPDAALFPLAKAMLDRRNPRKWYSALMDYGTMLKKQHGNASRRSVHYKKQSRFDGSRRQKRGRIMRLLMAVKSLTSEEFSRQLKIPPSLLNGILGELIRDQIVIKTRNRYLIA
jgi:A/G-specific adenine glycosylase